MKLWIHSGWFNTHPETLTKQVIDQLAQDNSVDQIRKAYVATLELEDEAQLCVFIQTNLLAVFHKVRNSVSIDILRKCPDHNQRFHVHDMFELVGTIFDPDAPDYPGLNVLDLPNSIGVRFRSVFDADLAGLWSREKSVPFRYEPAAARKKLRNLTTTKSTRMSR